MGTPSSDTTTESDYAAKAGFVAESVYESTSFFSESNVENDKNLFIPDGTNTTFQVNEMTVKRDGLVLYGQFYMPDVSGRPPVVILSHGLGVNYMVNKGYAEFFAAHGFAAYIFDFAGGSIAGKSDGDTLEMSVLTEAEDLNCAIDSISGLDNIDPDRIFLFGESQGGLVSAYVAADRKDEISGLVLFYPAFVLPELCWELIKDQQDIPARNMLLGVEVGKKYFQDMMSIDIDQIISQYSGRVLIIHGTDDQKVPVSYSKYAADKYADAQLILIDGADHGFFADNEATAKEYALNFLIQTLK